MPPVWATAVLHECSLAAEAARGCHCGKAWLSEPGLKRAESSARRGTGPANRLSDGATAEVGEICKVLAAVGCELDHERS